MPARSTDFRANAVICLRRAARRGHSAAMTKFTYVPVAFALALAACDVTPPPADAPAMPPADQDTCGAAPYATLIGQRDTALERVLILRQVRVIRPGQAITMDFRPERINFVIDEQSLIARIYCG